MTVFLFAICYFFLATWTYGLYVPSGLFVPVILCGAAWGRMFGDCVYKIFPQGKWSEPGIYALIGSASMLGEAFDCNVLFTSLQLILYKMSKMK